MSLPGLGTIAAVTGIAAASVAGLLSALSTSHGVPQRAAQAYLVAAATAPCPIDYRTLTAVGAVESGHGTHGGSTLDDDGRVTGAIVSTAGATGPMQFMPATWQAYATDGDGDGREDVNDIDDAAAAAAKLLCASNVDEDLDDAVGSYNGGANWRQYSESQSYVAQVDERIAALPGVGTVGGAAPTSSALAGPAPEWCGVDRWINEPGDCSKGLQGILAQAWAATGGALNDPSTPKMHAAWAWLNGEDAAPSPTRAAAAQPAAGPTLVGSEGLQPDFAQRLARLAGAAPGSVTIRSGYRTTDEQLALGGGDPDCGKYVACVTDGVCGSMHCQGLAVDLRFDSDATKTWVHDHAVDYGLTFPMSWEDWHIEPVGARG